MIHAIQNSEWSVAPSYPSMFSTNQAPVPPLNDKKKTYNFVFDDGEMAVSYGMMVRLCQEGHIFKLLIFGGGNFKEEAENLINPIEKLKPYGITRKIFQRLVFGLRTNDAKPSYKYRFLYDSIGGFKHIDRYHMKIQKQKNKNKKKTNTNSENVNTTPIISLISDDELEFD